MQRRAPEDLTEASQIRKLKNSKVLFFVFVLSIFFAETGIEAIPAKAEVIQGKVARVLDGDTIHLATEIHPVGAKTHRDGSITVRLRGIDSPEKRQLYGIEAKDNLASLVADKTVKVEVIDIDRYGRIVGYVFLDTKNINLEQVKAGYAWAYTKYLDRPYASEFYEAEKKARDAKKGLWKDNNPTPPWEWRKRKCR